MSLFVVLKKKDETYVGPISSAPAKKQREFEFHVPLHLPEFTGEEIDFIQADCDELDAIKDAFAELGAPTYSIPMPRNRVVRWYGDIAKTIYFNLK